MSLITENPTNLQTLPYDVIRSIIRVGQESIEGIRMISHTWNSAALDHFKDRKRLPVIELFSWSEHFVVSIRGVILMPVVSMIIPPQYHNYFGLDNKWRKNGSDVDSSDIFKYREIIFNRFEHLFSRCSHVERIELKNHEDKNENDMIFLKKTLEVVTVNELAFTELLRFTETFAVIIIDILRLYPFKQLILSASWSLRSVCTITGNDFFSSFVAQCVKLVSEILITKVCEEGNGVFDPEYWTRQVTTINRQKEAKATWDVYDMEEGKKMAFISIKPRVTNH